MTPYLSKLAIKAMNDETVTRAWIAASLMRAKKLPKLEKLLQADKQDSKAEMESRMKTALKGLSKKKGS